MNRRIETYFVLGFYFAIGLFFGYLIGKDSEKMNYSSKSSYGENSRLRVRR